MKPMWIETRIDKVTGEVKSETEQPDRAAPDEYVEIEMRQATDDELVKFGFVRPGDSG